MTSLVGVARTGRRAPAYPGSMARSPLTLAASVTAALPRATVIGAAPLSTLESGRFDSAVVTLDTGDQVVVRASNDDAGASELAAESIALRALTPGTRALLPFVAPEFHGEAVLANGRVLVVDWVPGYAVEPAHLPGGVGAATSLGIAFAALHALPPSVVRAVGLPVRSAETVRTQTRDVVDRASATGRLPAVLAHRWGDAIDDDRLWGFEPTVVLGDASANSFRFEDRDGVPTVSGVIGWSGLSVGDPAIDLHWLEAAADALADVHAAYADAASRAPDSNLRVRARLYAELEFAKWLLHGYEQREDSIVDDAAALLDALVAGLADSEPFTAPAEETPDAWGPPMVAASLAAASGGADPSTAMQTDAYDPELLSLFTDKVRVHGDASETEAEIVAVDLSESADEPAENARDGRAASESDPVTQDRQAHRDQETQPLDVDGEQSHIERAEIPADLPQNASTSAVEAVDSEDETREAERASRAAFHRWTSPSSE